MSATKCVVEGCNLEYDVICSFSFYNVNSTESEDKPRQGWVSGAMQEESECLWRHVSLQLCGYHFELDSQGLWIDSPMLPELLTIQDKTKQEPEPLTEEQEKALECLKNEHNYTSPKPDPEPVSRLNVRQLVDTLGYLSMKNLQKKQLWVVKVETEKGEASITQAEQVITKMQEPMQIIEIVPQTAAGSEKQEAEQTTSTDNVQTESNEVLEMMDESNVSDNFIYEIAEEQEISMDEVSEIPMENQEWTVNIVPDQERSKYAFIKHCNTGKKKRHFTAEMNEVAVQGDYDNYYILPDADPSVGVEITTSSYEPEYRYDLLLHQPRKKQRKDKGKREGKQIKTELVPVGVSGEDWVIENNVAFDHDESDDYDPKNKSRARRKNKKYLGYDFVT